MVVRRVLVVVVVVVVVMVVVVVLGVMVVVGYRWWRSVGGCGGDSLCKDSS